MIKLFKLRLLTKLLRLSMWRRRMIHMRRDVMQDGEVIHSLFLGRWMFAAGRKPAPPKPLPTWHKAPFYTA